MKYLNYLIVVLLLVFVTSCSKDEIVEVTIPEVVEEKEGIVDGLYAISFFDEQTYNTVPVSRFRDNLLQYYPAYAFEFKDSLVVDVLQYPDVKQYWNIETNKRALLRFSDRRYATTEFATKLNSNDSLPYVTYVESADPKVIKLKYRDPSENRTRYAFARLLEGEDTDTYISDYYSNTGFFRDSIYSKLDAWDYHNLLDGFIEDAARHGVDLSYVDRENSSLVLSDNPLAPAWVQWETNCDLTLSRVYFARDVWENTGIYDKDATKLIIMWHELGHDLLNMAHWAGGGQVMSSSVGPKGSARLDCNTGMYDLSMNTTDNCKDWERAVDDLFEHFREFQESGEYGEYQNNCS